MDRGAWWAIVYGVAKGQAQLSTHTHTHTHTQRYFKNVFLKSGLLMCEIQSLWNISCGHRKIRCMRWVSMGIQIAHRGGFI